MKHQRNPCPTKSGPELRTGQWEAAEGRSGVAYLRTLPARSAYAFCSRGARSASLVAAVRPC